METGLTRQKILFELEKLSNALGAHAVKGELCLFGGTVMVVVYEARISTKDVDAIFQPTEIIRKLSAEIAEADHLPADWLNDGVKGFVSDRQDYIQGNLPQFPHLALTMPTPEYLLAMKCMASRLEGNTPSKDVQDIIFLAKHLGLKDAKSVIDIVAGYYPPERIPIKAQYLVESLFEEGLL